MCSGFVAANCLPSWSALDLQTVFFYDLRTVPLDRSDWRMHRALCDFVLPCAFRTGHVFGRCQDQENVLGTCCLPVYLGCSCVYVTLLEFVAPACVRNCRTAVCEAHFPSLPRNPWQDSAEVRHPYLHACVRACPLFVTMDCAYTHGFNWPYIFFPAHKPQACQ